MPRRILDVSGVPTVVFGSRTTVWLGFVGVIVVEGMMILLIFVGYFYLGGRAAAWPPGIAPPPLDAGLVNTAVYILSTVPALWLKRAAEKADIGRVRELLLVLSVVAVATIALSGWAFASLNTRWDSDAYGSLIWMLLGTHVAVLIAAALVIWALALFMFWGKVEGQRFINVYESGDYWLLAVFLWLPTWFVIYIASRSL